jgi:hypothetical protein
LYIYFLREIKSQQYSTTCIDPLSSPLKGPPISRTIYSLHISGQDADEKEDDAQKTEYLREVKNLDTSKLSDITGDGLRRSAENNPNSA